MILADFDLSSAVVESKSSLHSESEKMSNAYVPYLYAKGCIAKMVGDMKSMMVRHQRITSDIERNYRSIEDETQVFVCYCFVWYFYWFN